MAWNLTDTLFGLFGGADKLSDTYKDLNGRGLDERFQRTLAGEFDEYSTPALNNLIGNTQEPRTVFAQFIPYLEAFRGYGFQVTEETDLRRKLLKYAARLNAIRGTLRSYDVVLKMLGFTDVTVTEHNTEFGFDSPVNWDDPVRRLDSRCRQCSDYTLSLTGPADITPALRVLILNVVRVCEPLNARLREIIYNGAALAGDHITFENNYGWLYYDNTNAPDDEMFIDAGLNLFVKGPNENRYSVQGGNIYFN